MVEISTILRLHDTSKLAYFERAIQSLHSQSSVSVYPIVVLQNFSSEEVDVVKENFDKNWYFNQHAEGCITNLIGEDGVDHRSALLNEGIKRHHERGGDILGFLDYDDILYGHAYELLSSALLESSTAIAFASLEMFHAIPLKDYDFIYKSSSPFIGKNKLDLLKENFCPIHSYLINTSLIDKNELYFRKDMTRVEDYEFLIRVAGRYPCDFSNIGKNIGGYFMRSDDSNSTPDWESNSNQDDKKRIWRLNRKILQHTKARTEIRFYATDI